MDTDALDKSQSFFHIFSRRMYLVISLMMSMCLIAYLRGSLGMTMTCMVNTTAVAIHHNTLDHKDLSSRGETALSEYATRCTQYRLQTNVTSANAASSLIDYGGELVWSRHEQNMLLSSLSVGSAFTMVPAGFLADKYSPVRLLKLSVATFMTLNAIFPFLVSIHYAAAYAARFAMGLAEGFVIPCSFCLVSRWIPVHEKSQAVTLITVGSQVAGVLYPSVNAAFCGSSLRWPGNFYALSLLALLWLLVFGFVGVDHPRESGLMSARERRYLERHLQCFERSKRAPVPLRHILRSPAVLSVVYCNLCFGFYVALLTMYMPTFFKEVLYMNMKENGIYSSLPPFFQIFAKFAWAIFIDKLKKDNVISNTTGCRLSHAVGSLSCALFFLLIGLWGDCGSAPFTVWCLVAMAVGSGSFPSGALTAVTSIAPLYTGFLASLSSIVLLAGSILLPAIVSAVRVHGTVEEWRVLFYLVSGLLLSSALLFCVFGDADEQAWAKPAPPPPVQPDELLSTDSKKPLIGSTDQPHLA